MKTAEREHRTGGGPMTTFATLYNVVRRPTSRVRQHAKAVA